eukprot:6017055-Prymnesium_polylepis.1
MCRLVPMGHRAILRVRCEALQANPAHDGRMNHDPDPSASPQSSFMRRILRLPLTQFPVQTPYPRRGYFTDSHCELV